MKEQKGTTIFSIPMKNRRTNTWGIFTTWADASASNGTWFVGGVLAACGLSVTMEVLVLSPALSYAFLSLVGYIGYKTGVSTMTLSRASFGEWGSYLPSLINITQSIGWTTVNTFIAAQSANILFHNLLGWPAWGQHGGYLGLVVGVIIISILHIINVPNGSRSVQMVERLGIILVLVFVIWESVAVFRTVSFSQIVNWHAPAQLKMAASVATDYVAAFNLAWVTAGTNLTRFITKEKNTILTPLLGALLGVIWFASISLISTISIAISSGIYSANNSDPSMIASKLGPGAVVLLVIILTSMTASAANLLTTESALSNIFTKLELKYSLWIVILLSAVVTFIPVFIDSSLSAFESFLDYVGVVLGPTIATIYTDFYFRTHRQYSIDELGEAGGEYWYHRGVNWVAIIVFAIGAAFSLGAHQLPIFVNTIGVTFTDMCLNGILYYGIMLLVDRKEDELCY